MVWLTTDLLHSTFLCRTIQLARFSLFAVNASSPLNFSLTSLTCPQPKLSREREKMQKFRFRVDTLGKHLVYPRQTPTQPAFFFDLYCVELLQMTRVVRHKGKHEYNMYYHTPNQYAQLVEKDYRNLDLRGITVSTVAVFPLSSSFSLVFLVTLFLLVVFFHVTLLFVPWVHSFLTV